MFCGKCGKENGQNEDYCRYCGERLTLPLEGSSPGYQMNELGQESTDSHEQKWVDFVGKSYQYYKFQWMNSDRPESALTWNWAAFFLGLFWLGYRKMYRPIFMILGLYLVVDLTEILTVFHPSISFVSNYIGLVISLFLGLFGNALYYRHAKKKIAKTQQLYPGERMEINLGGTSAKGVFTAIGSLLGYALIATLSLLILTRGMILFSESWRGIETSDYSDHFSHYEHIYYDVNLGERAQTDQLDVVLYLENQGTEEVYGQFVQEIEPNSFGFSGLLITPYTDYYGIMVDPDPDLGEIFEPGHYRVRIYRDDDLLSEGQFEIEPSTD